MNTEFRPAPMPRRRRDPAYKPSYRPRPVRSFAIALCRTLREYAELMRLHRPIGIWLLMWPALWGLWIAGAGRPDSRIFTIFMAGVVVMRTAACIINDYVDRDLDPLVRRTAERPLATGRVRPGEALVLFVALGLVASGLVLQLDPLARLYAAAGGALAVTYPFIKRFVHVPQFYLGFAFACSIPMAFAALSGSVPKLAWLMVTAVVLWAAVYDSMYAMVDRDDDLKIGLKSTAVLFGDADRVFIGAMQAMTLLALTLVGSSVGLGNWYRCGLAAGLVIFLYQQWLIHDRNPERCFQAFNNNNYFGMVVFIGLALDYLFR